MFPARLLRHLLAGPVGDHRFQRSIQQALHERQLATRLAGNHQLAGGHFHDARRHTVVGQAHSFGSLGIQRLAGQHQIQCGSRANPLRQAQHAAPAGKDAEHDFRQPHFGTRFIDRQQVTTGQRQFQSSAQAMPTDQGQRRVFDRCQPVEQIPAALDQRPALFRGIELGKLLDIRPGDEAGILAGANDQAFGRMGVKLV